MQMTKEKIGLPASTSLCKLTVASFTQPSFLQDRRGLVGHAKGEVVGWTKVQVPSFSSPVTGAFQGNSGYMHFGWDARLFLEAPKSSREGNTLCFD